MKAIIEIELEVDGEWRKSDKKILIENILAHPEYWAWTIEEDRLNIVAIGRIVEIRFGD